MNNILFLKCCEVCGSPHVRSGRYCSRECFLMMVEFEEFYTLRLFLSISRWTGGESQAQLRAQYFTQQIRDGVRQLPTTSDLLAEALIEILEGIPSGLEGEDAEK